MVTGLGLGHGGVVITAENITINPVRGTSAETLRRNRHSWKRGGGLNLLRRIHNIHWHRNGLRLADEFHLYFGQRLVFRFWHDGRGERSAHQAKCAECQETARLAQPPCQLGGHVRDHEH